MVAAVQIFLLALATQAAQPGERAVETAAEPDISLDATVTAESVRWRQAGDMELSVWSQPEGVNINESLSTGLPDPIPVGRTFRHIEWRVRLRASIAPPEAPAAPEPPEPASQDPQ